MNNRVLIVFDAKIYAGKNFPGACYEFYSLVFLFLYRKTKLSTYIIAEINKFV